MCTKFCWEEPKEGGYWWKDNIKVDCKGRMGEFGMLVF
jgi:hypothetical protein